MLEINSIDGQIIINSGSESITVDGRAFLDLIYSRDGKRLLRDASENIITGTKPHRCDLEKSHSRTPQKKERGMEWWANFALGITAETAEPDHVYSCFLAPSQKGNEQISNVSKSDRA